jgi:electron transfer flavoprotein beta subunit
MRVAVCCKGVPIDLKVESVHLADGDFQCGGTDLYINEFDAYALEAAMALKNTYGAETVAVSLGPLRVQEVLHFAIAKGIDQVLRVDGDNNRPELIASGLLPILRKIDPQIILVGVQSEDWMGGEVGIYLSQALNMGVAYAVVEICELDDTHIRVMKELGGGKKAEVVLRLPAVLCVQSGIQPLQYVSAVKRKKAREKPVTLGGKLDKEDARQKIPGMMAYEATEVALPSREGYAEILTGERPESAAKLLEIIRKSI